MFIRIDGFLLHMWRQCNLPTRCTEAGLRSQSQNEGLLKQIDIKPKKYLPDVRWDQHKGSNESWTSCLFAFQLYGLSWQKSDEAVFTCSFGRFFYHFGTFMKSYEIIDVKSVSERHPEFLELHQNFFLQPQVARIPPLQPSLLLTTTTNAQLKPSLTGNPIKHLKGHRKQEDNSMK